MSHRLLLVLAAVSLGLAVPALCIQAPGMELFRYDIPALRLPGDQGLALDNVDRRRDDAATKASKTVMNSVRKCVYEEHPFRQASRAWDIIIAGAASRFIPAQLIARRLVVRMEKLLLEYWVAIVDDHKDEPASFKTHCKNVFRGICSDELFQEASEKCIGDETEGCNDFLESIRDKILVEVFGNSPDTAATVAGAVGNDPGVIRETIEKGNLREIMTLAFMKERALTPVFVYFSHNPRTSGNDLFSNDENKSVSSMLNMDLIKTACPPKLCQPGKRSMNRIMYGHTKNYWVWRNNQANFERRQRKDKGTTPPKVRLADLEYMGTGFSDREKAFFTSTKEYEELENKGDFMFKAVQAPWFTGSHRWSVDQESDYGISAYAAFLNQVAGPSGTTARSFLTAKALGFSDKDLAVFRLSLIGYLVPWQHSLLEVVLGSAEFLDGFVDLDSRRIHTTLLPPQFLWNYADGGVLKTKFTFEDWKNQILGQVREYQSKFRKAGSRVHDALAQFLRSSKLDFGEAYQQVVFQDGEFRADDPLPLIAFFGGQEGKGPTEFLTAGATKRTLLQCLRPIYAPTSSAGSFKKYGEDASGIISRCLSAEKSECGEPSQTPECTPAFTTEEAAQGDPSEPLGCRVSAKSMPENFKTALSLSTGSTESGRAFIVIPEGIDATDGGADDAVGSVQTLFRGPTVPNPKDNLSLRFSDASDALGGVTRVSRQKEGSGFVGRSPDKTSSLRGEAPRDIVASPVIHIEDTDKPKDNGGEGGDFE